MKRIILFLSCLALGTATFAQEKVRPVYDPNIIRIHPITVFSNEGFVGLGFNYERILDKDGKIGFNLPFSLGMQNVYSGYNNNVTLNYAYSINPGIKFYPAGQRRVSYALGISVFVTTGDNDYANYSGTDPNGVPIYTQVDGSLLQAGMMLNNYVHFSITRKLQAGLELGIGPSYLNRRTENGVESNYGIEVYPQIGMSIGYRF